MKIGQNVKVYADYDEMLSSWKAIRDLGYDTADVLMHDTSKEWYHSDEAMEDICQKIRKCAAESGLILNQLHGPWPTDDTTAKSRETVICYMKRCVDICGRLGVPYMVIHPQMPFGWGEEHDNGRFAFDLTVELLKALVPLCEKYNVTVCLENMPMRAHRNSVMENIVKMVKAANSPYIGICMDTGHSNIMGCDAGDDVRLAGSLVKTLHVHDNNGMSDQHTLPYLGTVDWESFTKALAETGYSGSFSMETEGAESKTMPKEARALSLKATAVTARYLADKVESYKK